MSGSDRAELAKRQENLADDLYKIAGGHGTVTDGTIKELLLKRVHEYLDNSATALSAGGGALFPGIKLESLSTYAKELRDIGAETIARAMEDAAIELADYRSGRLPTSIPTPQALGEDELREILAQELDRAAQPNDKAMAVLLRDPKWQPHASSLWAPILSALRRLSPSADLIAATAPPDDSRVPYGHCIGRTPFERTIEHLRGYLPNPHEGTDCRDAAADSVFQGMIGEVLAFAMRGVVRIAVFRNKEKKPNGRAK